MIRNLFKKQLAAKQIRRERLPVGKHTLGDFRWHNNPLARALRKTALSNTSLMPGPGIRRSSPISPSPETAPG